VSLAQKLCWRHIKKEYWPVIFDGRAGELFGTHGRDVIEERRDDRKVSDVLPIRRESSPLGDLGVTLENMILRDAIDWENIL
jgi:hypothetical protein